MSPNLQAGSHLGYKLEGVAFYANIAIGHNIPLFRRNVLPVEWLLFRIVELLSSIFQLLIYDTRFP